MTSPLVIEWREPSVEEYLKGKVREDPSLLDAVTVRGCFVRSEKLLQESAPSWVFCELNRYLEAHEVAPVLTLVKLRYGA